jgi:hypothetical protein
MDELNRHPPMQFAHARKQRHKKAPPRTREPPSARNGKVTDPLRRRSARMNGCGSAIHRRNGNHRIRHPRATQRSHRFGDEAAIGFVAFSWIERSKGQEVQTVILSVYPCAEKLAENGKFRDSDNDSSDSPRRRRKYAAATRTVHVR